jgi:hypothetical protein
MSKESLEIETLLTQMIVAYAFEFVKYVCVV